MKHIKWTRTFSYHCHLLFSFATLSHGWENKHRCRLFDCPRGKEKILSPPEKIIYINRSVIFFQQFFFFFFFTDSCEKHFLRNLQNTDRLYRDPLTYFITNSQHHCQHIWLNTDELPLKFFSSKADIFWTVNPLIFEKEMIYTLEHIDLENESKLIQAYENWEIAKADLSCISFSEFFCGLSKWVVQPQYNRKEFTTVIGSLSIVCWCDTASFCGDEVQLE